ncbi:hypothetical protein A0J61_05641 [Choanephora cucurbitarum]|uniref:Uncharacterized protein n=1 Tax=Choanephora cucurbitarum TaxID=101091 RepID=A0A1C7NC41_9FUNG|nr:hypothetical protein A0J61_05641 [Choanephora cucurbitarum]
MRFITVSLALVVPFLLASSAASIGRRDTQMISMVSQDGSQAQNIVAVHDIDRTRELDTQNNSNLVASNSGNVPASGQTQVGTMVSSEQAERVYMVMPSDEDDLDEMNEVLLLNGNVNPPPRQNENVVMTRERLENERDELLRKRDYDSDELELDAAELGGDSDDTE